MHAIAVLFNRKAELLEVLGIVDETLAKIFRDS
jgi:hypothetical protein